MKPVINYSYYLNNLLFCILILASSCSETRLPNESVVVILDSAKYYSDTIRNLEKSFEMYNKASHLASQIGDKQLQLEAQFGVLNILYTMGSHKDLLELVYEVEELALKQKDHYLLGLILRMKSLTLTTLGLNKESLKELNRAFSYAAKVKDSNDRNLLTGHLHIAAIVVHSTNVEQPEHSEKRLHTKKAYDHLVLVDSTSRKGKQALSTALDLMATTYMDDNKPDSAEHTLLAALKLFEKDSIRNASEFYSLELLGTLYVETNRFQEAIDAFLDALQIAQLENNPQHKSRLYLRLQDAHAGIGNEKQAAEYLTYYTAISDSLRSAEKITIKIPLLQIEKAKDIQVNKNKKIALWISAACFVFFALALLLYFLLRKEKISSQEKDRLLQEKIQEFSHAGVKETTAPVLKSFKELTSMAIENNPSFLTAFQIHHPDFCARLEELATPRLISSELEICAYLRLNFETKEIARYTNSSIRSVENKKYRIRKKLNIPSDEDIKLWMSKVV